MSICTDWTDETAVAVCYPDVTAADPQLVAQSITTAGEILYSLTGRQFPGQCTATLRPCSNPGNRAGWTSTSWTYPWTPLKYGSTWVNVGPCGCHMTSCGCKPVPQINLGRTDIQEVTQVLVDGDPFLDFTLWEHQYVIRDDGDLWPCCQDLTKPDTEPGTWSVTVEYGYPIPESLQHAAAVLAAELVKGCVGGECRLPPRTLSIVKQGVTIQVAGVLEEFRNGLTGLTEVDMAITAYNPYRLTRPPRVWSPELGRNRRQPPGT